MISQCAVERRVFLVGANPTQQLSLSVGSSQCIAPGSLDTSLSHAAGLSDIAVCHA